MKRFLGLLACCLSFVSSTGQFSSAGVIALDITDPNAPFPTVNSGGTAGWEFEVTSNVTVVSLGYFDKDGDGLGARHQVGLWKADDQTLLSSAFVDNSGTSVASASGLGNWAFVPVTPIQLVPGSYVVGGIVDNVADPIIWGGTTPVAKSTAPEISFVRGRDAIIQPPIPNFTFPDITVFDAGFFGPNVELASPSVVPEPASLAIFGIGALGLVATGVRRRKQMQE